MATKKNFETKYGYFTDNGKEYVITRPDTPRPWVNVICPNEYGLIISQCGSGYSWYKNANIFRITRWEQDLISDNWGKYIYAVDNTTKQYWSLTYKPVCKQPDYYECRHGIGYTTIKSLNYNINSEITFFVPPDETLEIWLVKLENQSSDKRSIKIFSYFEWFLGHIAETHREFHKLFITTEYDSNKRIIFAHKKGAIMQEYIAYHTTSIIPDHFYIDKKTFTGMYGSIETPAVLNHPVDTRQQFNHSDDPIASFQLSVDLEPNSEKEFVFLLGVNKQKDEIYDIINKYNSVEKAKESLSKTKLYWEDLIDKTVVETPDKAFDIMTNIWLKYQAISGRINGRTGYYQPGGAIGFRDQLQDSQIFLSLSPQLTKRQIILHAKHQYKDGVVQHWWQPVTDEGPGSEHSDDLLWLVFVVLEYLKETADFSILDYKVPYIDSNSPAKIYDHCVIAIKKVLSRMSPRGLPLILKGDWNDGLSSVGEKGKGESVWLGCFMVGIIDEWLRLHKYLNKKIIPEGLEKKFLLIKTAINKYCWDGNWYIRATKDSGEPLGSKNNKYGRIFLNPQIWAIINRIAPKERISKLLNSIEKYLYKDYGPLLLWPAYSEPDKEIGYLTRYSSGSRENGGVYTHAATWAILAECKLKRNKKVWDLYKKISPVYRGLTPELYLVEPYVTPGNSDGIDSKFYGRGGWTWYTGSAAWLFKVSTEWILGIHPTYDGLFIDPCLPPYWKKVKIKRFFRNAYYEIEMSKEKEKSQKIKYIYVDSKPFNSQILPVFNDNKIHKVKVIF